MNKYYNMIRMYNILESDTNDLGSTIHFDAKNLETFGMRVYNLFFMSCNLFEVAAQEIVGDNTDMGDWKNEPAICQFSTHEMRFVPMDYKFEPLEALGETDINSRNLTWWQDYNSVKHDLTQIQKATLRNLIYALASAGLLVTQAYQGAGSVSQSLLFDGLYIPYIR